MIKTSASPLIPSAVALVLLAQRATADPDDGQFLQATSAVGLVSDDGPTGFIRLAHSVCHGRVNGYSDLISATMVNKVNSGLGMNGAGFIVAAPEHVYGPQFSRTLPPS